MKLTAIAVRNARAMPKPQKLADGNGLFLLVTPTGSKLWRLKYRIDGKEKLMALGKFPEVGLSEARQASQRARASISSALDPMADRKRQKIAAKVASSTSFEAVAREWWQQWQIGKSPRHAQYVIRRLEADIFPTLGIRPIADIEAPEIVALVQGIVARGVSDLAVRALQTCGQIFRFACARSMCRFNPAATVRPADLQIRHEATNYARVDAKELPQLLRAMEAYVGNPSTRIALQLLALNFVRTTELIEAQWSEFDLEAGRWDIPANRMKMKTPHIVPLANESVRLLKVLQELSGDRRLLFPGERDHEKSMSNNTILKALERMGYKGRMTGHGFRGVASTVLHEMGFKPELIELQLAHQRRNKTAAAYNHATHLQERANMMQHWSDYLKGLTEEKVIAFRKAI